MVALSFEGGLHPELLLHRKTPHNLQKQKVISYNATNTMIRNRKACMTAAIPASFVLQEGKTMKKKINTLSIRLTNNELDTINIVFLIKFAAGGKHIAVFRQFTAFAACHIMTIGIKINVIFQRFDHASCKLTALV